MRAVLVWAPFEQWGLLGAAAGLSLAGCGSRSEVFGSAAVDSGGPEASFDAGRQVQMGMFCDTDADCLTDRFCIESFRCDPLAGCVLSPRSCDDGVACTVDECSEATRSCIHSPDDGLCPTTQLCSPARGCDAFVYGIATDAHLYEVRVPSGSLVDLGLVSSSPSDIALGNGVLYATESYNLFKVDRATASATAIASILPLHQYNGLGTGPTSALLATAYVADVFQVNASNGSATLLTSLPAGYRVSDVTSYGGAIFVAATFIANPTSDVLLSFDPGTLAWSGAMINLGESCAWGLATLGSTVYALTCSGGIVEYSGKLPVTVGASQPLRQFLGAAGR